MAEEIDIKKASSVLRDWSKNGTHSQLTTAQTGMSGVESMSPMLSPYY